MIQSGWLPGTTSVCFYFTNYRLNEWEKKTPCFVPCCSSFSTLKPKQKQFGGSAKHSTTAAACEDTHNSLLFFVRWYIVNKIYFENPKVTRGACPSLFCFFSPRSDSERWIQNSRSVFNYCDFPKIYSRAILFRPLCSDCHCVFLSDRLSRHRIVPRAPMEDGARWLVYSRWLHRGGSHSDLWRQGNTASSVQVRAKDDDSVRRGWMWSSCSPLKTFNSIFYTSIRTFYALKACDLCVAAMVELYIGWMRGGKSCIGCKVHF